MREGATLKKTIQNMCGSRIATVALIATLEMAAAVATIATNATIIGYR